SVPLSFHAAFCLRLPGPAAERMRRFDPLNSLECREYGGGCNPHARPVWFTLTLYACNVEGPSLFHDVSELRDLGELVRDARNVPHRDPQVQRHRSRDYLRNHSAGEHDLALFYRPDCRPLLLHGEGFGRAASHRGSPALYGDAGHELRSRLRPDAGL